LVFRGELDCFGAKRAGGDGAERDAADDQGHRQKQRGSSGSLSIATALTIPSSGVGSRPLSDMLYHRTGERGLFLGFAAWNEEEIDHAARILGRIMR
jgi:hypothetical protein